LPTGLTLGTGASVNPASVKPRLIGTEVTTPTIPGTGNISCYGVSTCALTGFPCDIDADCPLIATNVCDATTLRCTVSGATCTVVTEATDCPVAAAAAPVGGCNATKCRVSGAACSADSDCPTTTDNTCLVTAASANQIRFRDTYDLGKSTEGIVPSFIGAIPKDPGGTGFVGISQTFTDLKTGYAIYNVPTAVSGNRALSGASGRIKVVSCNPTIQMEIHPTLTTKSKFSAKSRTFLCIISTFCKVKRMEKYILDQQMTCVNAYPSITMKNQNQQSVMRRGN